ncbi:Chitin synthase regulatory factor 3 [Rhizoctonia solani]|uniref:Chitin synthase regulatory factor 3 n=1 Tax=Rhizoctonia solani TaxID=456999 RepID=A0A0K6G155_9AGAM|nr:Chitin synthase regulatory factor 3 [Rhizoctonia solani]
MVNTPPPPAIEPEGYSNIVDLYDSAHDGDAPSHPSNPSTALVPAPSLREGTMNGQGPRQTSLHLEGGEMVPAPGRQLMQLANRSTPALPHPRDIGFDHPPLPNSRHHGPPPYDPNDPNSLPFHAMQINDPIQRAGTSMSYRAGDPRADPIPRSGTSMSHRMPPPRGASAYPPHPQWRGPPPQAHPGHPGPQAQVFDSASVYSGNSGGYSEYDQFDDRASIRSGTMIPYGHYPPRGPPPPGPYHRPPPEGMYAAASVAGLDLPPGAAPPPSLYIPPAPAPAPNQAPYYPPGPNGPGPSEGYLSPSQSSVYAGSSAASIRTEDTADDFQMRPSLQRAGTTMTVAPNTKKTKAVDMTQLPYTKEFVEQYRARMKEDPDPEAHFNYAKYLIEAAKRIGEGAEDQRSVRKYRDTLIGESLKVIRKLATTGETYADAQFFLANCCGTGMLGLQVDHEKAYHLYMQAAKQQHPAASYRVAVCNEIGAGTRKDVRHAVAFYRKAASLGDTAAMYKLGMIFLQGQLGQPKSPRDAIPWLRRAAEQADAENPHALHELGLLHEQPGSQIVVHDEAYAKDLFTRAAQLGYVRSQFKLGTAYEYGQLTCPVDPKRSIAWYTKAAQKGDPEAELALSGWYLTGSEGVLKQSDSEAYLWARRAANKGLSKAEYAVGYYAEVGIGLKIDIEFAKRWYMRAAAQGNKRAMARLTDLKRAGNRRVGAGARPTRAQANKEDCVIA